MKKYFILATLPILLLGIVSASRPRLPSGWDWTEKAVIPIQGAIDAPLAIKTVSAIEQDLGKGEKDIYILINSPGGDVMAGYLIISAMQNARAQGVRIHCMVPFLAASMAMHILAYCDQRGAIAESLLLFHEVRAGGGAITPSTAKQIEEAMRILAKPLEDHMISELGVTQEEFDHHNKAETLWPAIIFQETFIPFGLELVPFIKVPAHIRVFEI